MYNEFIFFVADSELAGNKWFQATFVFLRPGADKDTLMKERDEIKEAIQQALIADRARVQKVSFDRQQL